MSSKHGNSNDQSLFSGNENNTHHLKKLALSQRLGTSGHVRHHSCGPAPIKANGYLSLSSRSNRRENQNGNLPPIRSSHRHTSSDAQNASASKSLNSNDQIEQRSSASQENLRHSDVNSSAVTSIAIKNSLPSAFPSNFPSETSLPNTASGTSITTPSGGSGSNLSPSGCLFHAGSSSSSQASASSSNSSTILNHFNIHNAKLIGLILFFALLFYHGSLRYIKGATSCHRLLNEGRIERYHVWQPTGCMIHWYDLLDFNQCARLITESQSTIDKSLLATRKAFNDRIDPGEWLRTRKQELERLKQEKQDKRKTNFFYTFVGDERLYMVYRTFINTIKYHSNLSRKKSATHENTHDEKQMHKVYPFLYKHPKNLTYADENFILQYYSVQGFNEYLYNLLNTWSNNNSIRPHVLILGLGLYDGIKENASTESLKYFESNLTRIKQHLVTNFSSTTTVFWFGQPRLFLNERNFQFSDRSYQQNEYISEFLPKVNGYIDQMNEAAQHVFHRTNIYWHSSTLLEEYSSLSKENKFLYDDNNDEYFDMNILNEDDNDQNHMIDHDPTMSSASWTRTDSSILSNHGQSNFSSFSQFDFDDQFQNQNETIYFSYASLKRNHTALTTAMLNSGKVHEFYKLSSFTRHTCVQILLNALCNPLLLPDDGTCCAQVPPLTRLQFIISLILGCSITFFVIYVVYRIRYVYILKPTRTSTTRYAKSHDYDEQNQQQHLDKNLITNGHCHMNGAFNKEIDDEIDEANETLLSMPNTNDNEQNYTRNGNINGKPSSNHSSMPSGLSRHRFLIPKFLRSLRKKSRDHLLSPLLLTTSIAAQSSSLSSSNGNGNGNSSYPSRFYKKQNSLLHFPLTEPTILRTSVKYAFILLYFYLADRTDFLMKENSHFSRIAFFLPLTYIGILGIFFHDKYLGKGNSNRSSPNQTPITTSPNLSNNLIIDSTSSIDFEQGQPLSDSGEDNLSASFSKTMFHNATIVSFLSREQINEMRGWMMVILLAYQMTDASGKSLVLSMCIQLLISAFLFLSGYAHFHYYWTTGNYQLLPFIQMLFKYNFLTITLCLLMNRHYQSYYYPPLISFYFTLMYFILGCIPPRISAESVKEKPHHLIYLLLKFLFMGLVCTILSMSSYLFEKIFTFRIWNTLFTTSTITSSLAAYVQHLDQSDLSHNGWHQLHTLFIRDKNSLYYNQYNTLLDYISGSGQGIVGPVAMNGLSISDKNSLYSSLYAHSINFTSHSSYDRSGTINDWYHRWNLDRYTTLYGMCFVFLILFIENYDTYKKFGITRKQCQQLASKFKIFSCLLSLIGLIVYFIVLFLCSNKAVCDAIHPYIIILPIVSYILLRNVPTFFRQYYSPFFSWFGNISLELFVAQYHIWLIANGHGTLTVIPRMPTLNLIITTFIFVCCCHELHRITKILTPVFVPNDFKCFIRNCLLYLLIIIVSSYMFSSI